MTLVHIVLFRFKSDVTAAHKETFIRELKQLRKLSCVKDGRLIVGGPSVTDPAALSKGFEFALVSFHNDQAGLKEYQESREHKWVVNTYLHDFKEDLVRFDFDVDKEDEYMCMFEGLAKSNGVTLEKDN